MTENGFLVGCIWGCVFCALVLLAVFSFTLGRNSVAEDCKDYGKARVTSSVMLICQKQ